MAQKRPERTAFKIIDVDEKMLSLEKNGQITTYVRTDSLNRKCLPEQRTGTHYIFFNFQRPPRK